MNSRKPPHPGPPLLIDFEAEKAVTLDPSSSDAHTALAHVATAEFKWDEAQREFNLALQADANNVPAHYFFAREFLIPQKRFDEAMPEYRKALAVDPLSGIVNTNYGRGLMIARHFDEAHPISSGPGSGSVIRSSASTKRQSGSLPWQLRSRPAVRHSP
jgi:Tfp pilus assembly protein PilF